MSNQPHTYLTAEEAERVNKALTEATETIQFLKKSRDFWKRFGLLTIGYAAMSVAYTHIKEFLPWTF